MEHNYEIFYENVYLRHLCEEDIEHLRHWRNDPSNTLYLSKIPYITTDMQKEWFNSYLEDNNELCFAIVENNVLQRLVGSLSLYQFTADSCLYGKLLIGDVEAHGKRVGVNATIAAIKIAFEQLKLRCVNLYVFKDNLSALNVYKKAGFEIVDEHINNGQVEYTMKIDNEGDK